MPDHTEWVRPHPECARPHPECARQHLKYNIQKVPGTFTPHNPAHQQQIHYNGLKRIMALWSLTSFTFRFSKAPWAACVTRCSYTGLLCSLRRTMRPLRPVISATLSGPPSLSINSSKGLVHTFYNIRKNSTQGSR